jgi:HD-like signal output (HDOD) protein
MLKKPYIIPAKPEVLVSLTAQLKSKQPNLNDVVKTLKSDASLYVLILSVVNNPLFSGMSEIKTLDQAVMRLGFVRLYSLVKLTVLKKSLSGQVRLNRFWDTATEVADLASTLTRYFKGVDVDDAYTVGMLHDCGIPFMLEQFPDYSGLLEASKLDSTATLVRNELNSYGIDHFTLGAEITSAWQMSESVSTAIQLQKNYPVSFLKMEHSVSPESKMLCCLLLLAKDISRRYRHYWRIDQSLEPNENLSDVLEYLGIPDVEYWDIRDDLLSELERIA